VLANQKANATDYLGETTGDRQSVEWGTNSKGDSIRSQNWIENSLSIEIAVHNLCEDRESPEGGAELGQPELLHTLEREWGKQHTAAVYWEEATRELADQLKREHLEALGQRADARVDLGIMLQGPGGGEERTEYPICISTSVLKALRH
jgi:hypothetical protein